MAHHKSAIKRIKTSRVARERNRQYRARMRLAVRKVFSRQESAAGEADFRQACALLDQLVHRGIIHRNMAARRKAQLHRHLSSHPTVQPAG